jgi:serine/threonine-protein kinase
LIGAKIAHYQIQSLLGQGGMGKVYKARNINLNKTCAIKVLPPEFARQDKALIDRFIREARSAASVEHPNVLPVHFVGKVSDNYFIEMQYMDGGSLQGLLCERGPLEPTEAARIVRDVASALEAAHEKGIIHRDIKPSNVMLTKKGQVFVADFGLAKVGLQATALTQSGMIMGTPLYMSPEQCQGKALDHRSDIYSLGAMFYEMLAGRLPYVAEDFAGLVAQHLTAPVPDIRAAVAGVPNFVAAIIMKMMAKRPEDRYQNCGELVQALNQFLAAPTAAARPAIVISESAIQKAHEARRAAVFGKKKRSPLPIVVSIVVVVVMGLAALYFTTETPRTATTAQTTKTPRTPRTEEAKPSVAPAPEQPPPTPTAQRPAPVQAQTPALAPTPAAPQAVAVPPKPEKPSVSSAPSVVKEAVDLVAYYDDIKQVNEKIDSGDYDAARARANLLKDKYPDLIATKLANLDRIESLRKRCFERVNSGAVKISMEDVSRRYAFGGEIQEANEKGLKAKMLSKGWDAFTKEEIASFYHKAADPNKAEDFIALAAFLVEGSVAPKDHEAALDMLGKAKGLGADVSAHLKYLDTLKQAAKEFAEAEAKGKELEGEGRKAEGEKERRGEGAKRRRKKRNLRNLRNLRRSRMMMCM